MKTRLVQALLLALALVLLLASCNLPPNMAPTPQYAQDTAVAGTVAALLTEAAPPPTAVLESTPTPTPTLSIASSATNTLIPAATPQNPLVVKDALCWEGPGTRYDVVSSVFTGTRVQLLGRGSIGAWWIIDNPRYHDPCWVMADVLQFDTGYNLSGIKVFTPQPSSTPTPTNTPTPTKTPTP
jgi:hypothetical protein